jgi:hypothetical protein
MAVFIGGGNFGTAPDGWYFDVLTNICSGFEMGTERGEDVWLQGKVIDGQFIFNGRLFTKSGQVGAIFDSFPARQAPEGWTQRRRIDVEGYELVNIDGEVIFSYRVDGKGCTVDVDLYKADGSLGVHRGQDGIICHIPLRM